MDLQATDLIALLLGLIGIAGAIVGVSRHLDARFNSLRSQLYTEAGQLRAELQQLKASIGVHDTRDLSQLEHLEYRVNSNRELIDHRTQRFIDERTRLEAAINWRFAQIEGFLAKTTEYTIRKYQR